jgi:hypothetical protein
MVKGKSGEIAFAKDPVISTLQWTTASDDDYYSSVSKLSLHLSIP